MFGSFAYVYAKQLATFGSSRNGSVMQTAIITMRFYVRGKVVGKSVRKAKKK